MALPDLSSFENAYTARPPWDIDEPQPNFVRVADSISGAVLDAGCGTGENALFLARRGCAVTGIDFLKTPIEIARKRALERNVPATFLVTDTLSLASEPKTWTAKFDNVLDSGLFHVFNDEDAEVYVAGLHRVLKPGGRVYLLCFSDAEPGEQGPRRIPKQWIYDRFGDGWTVESVTPTRFQIRDELREKIFSGEDPYAWFAIIRRA